MFTKVSVLVPTRHRVERLRTLISSFYATTCEQADLVFRVDEDDLETIQFLLGRKVVIGPRYQGYQSMPLFYNELFAAATGDVLLCGNDDMVFRTASWPSIILEAANKYPDGLFDIGVLTHNETHYPFSIVSRKAAERMGFLWDPTIFWGDIFLRDVMAAFGRCVMLPEVVIEHDWAGNKPDQVFRESDKNITLRDRTYWTGTHARAVNNAIEVLRPLLDVVPLRAEELGFAYD
jgi:hypothetical protein